MASGAFAKKYLKRPVSRPRYKGEVKVNICSIKMFKLIP